MGHNAAYTYSKYIFRTVVHALYVENVGGAGGCSDGVDGDVADVIFLHLAKKKIESEEEKDRLEEEKLEGAIHNVDKWEDFIDNYVLNINTKNRGKGKAKNKKKKKSTL